MAEKTHSINMKQAKYFSVSVDSTLDVSHTYRLIHSPLCQTCSVISKVHRHMTMMQSIALTVVQIIKDLSAMIGQSYDCCQYVRYLHWSPSQNKGYESPSIVYLPFVQVTP